MSYLYEQHKRPQAKNMTPEPATAPGPDMNALISGQAQPTAAMKGTSFDLDGAVKAKMEHAFGDLSAVKLYQSQAVADAGAEAIAQGNEIAFAPGKTDFSTRSGQERLGHELSHVMSQRSGQVTGQGFLANASLEARADREGAMAAAGEQIYGGAAAPLTMASAAPAAGPMQAKRGGNQEPQRSPLAGPELIYERDTWSDARNNWKRRFNIESGRRMRDEIALTAEEAQARRLAKNRVGDTRRWMGMGSSQDRARREVMESRLILDDDDD